MEIIIFGIGASILSELISVVKKWLSATPFEGVAAQLVVIVVSLISAVIELLATGQVSISLSTLWPTATQIWALAEVYYIAIGQWYATHTTNNVPLTPPNSVN